MKLKFLKIAQASLILVVSSVANAGLITGITVDSTTLPTLFSTNFVNTINGSGLVGGVPSLTASHSATSPVNSAVQLGSTLSVTYDLGALYDISGFSFWNQNAGGPGPAGSAGVRDFSIFSSMDGLNYSLQLSSTFDIKALNVEVPQQFAMSTLATKFIRLNGLNNYGYTATGFAEIQFDGTASVTAPAPNAVPEPSTLAIFV